MAASAVPASRPLARASRRDEMRWRRLGVSADRIYVDHELTGTDGDRPGLARPSLRAAATTRWWSRAIPRRRPSTAELGHLLGVGRSTVQHAIERETRRREQQTPATAGVARS